MSQLDADMEQAIAVIKSIDTRAEEILDHDPELVKLYYLNKEWKLSVMALQGQVIDVVEGEQFVLQIQNWIGDYKDMSSKIREHNPIEFFYEGCASDCADAIDAAAARLKLLASEFRNRISEISPLSVEDTEQLEKVEKAGHQAMLDSFKGFRH